MKIEHQKQKSDITRPRVILSAFLLNFVFAFTIDHTKRPPRNGRKGRGFESPSSEEGRSPKDLVFYNHLFRHQGSYSSVETRNSHFQKSIAPISARTFGKIILLKRFCADTRMVIPRGEKAFV